MAISQFVQETRNNAAKLNLKVAFPDAADERTLKASEFLAKEKIAQPVLVGSEAEIKAAAEKHGVKLDNVEIADPEKSEYFEDFAVLLQDKRKHKGMTLDEARELVKNPLYFSGLMLDTDKVKVCVGGNVSSTGDVMRAAIYTVGVGAGISIVSSFFIMEFPDRKFCFADCAVNPNPDANQLADIAISSAKNYKAITGEEPRVAMLSFSTNGSADHELVHKVQEATRAVNTKEPELPADGEMQLDAAIIPAIGERKFPGSEVAGKANVLVFPDLNAGNIGYKLVQRLAGAEAIGPIVQGLKKPYCDLSRGCSVDDMINVAAICSLMA
ncbi:MAG: phosphate acetyltransferase [Candidatus Kapaibacterium sp.]